MGQEGRDERKRMAKRATDYCYLSQMGETQEEQVLQQEEHQCKRGKERRDGRQALQYEAGKYGSGLSGERKVIKQTSKR